jgi:hypothetical protein
VIVHGRITLFGEYLMHSMTEGYVMPSDLALATADEYAFRLHAEYQPALDRVRLQLDRDGFPTCTVVRGNLPLGHGFASSTALTILHLGAQRREGAEAIAHRVDQEIHGFTPSGVDYWSITAGHSGYFGPAGWRSIASSYRLAASALLVPENSYADLAETRNKINLAADGLIPIARYLCATLKARHVIDYRALLDYAIYLRRIGAYFPRAEAIIDHVFSRGLVAKGIGGLTNKAVVIIWPPGMRPSEQGKILDELGQYNPDAVLPRI